MMRSNMVKVSVQVLLASKRQITFGTVLDRDMIRHKNVKCANHAMPYDVLGPYDVL